MTAMSVIRDKLQKAALERDGSFVMHFTTFQGLKASLFKVFGPSATAIIYDAGTEPGRRSYLTLVKECKTKEEVLALLIQHKANENWGDVEFHNLDWQGHSGKILVARCSKAEECIRGSTMLLLQGLPRGLSLGTISKRSGIGRGQMRAKGDARCEFTFQ